MSYYAPIIYPTEFNDPTTWNPESKKIDAEKFVNRPFIEEKIA